MDEALLKARVFRRISYTLGLIIPSLVLVIILLLLVVVAAIHDGWAALGFGIMASFLLPVISFILGIPLGIAAIAFGVRAMSIAKSLPVAKTSFVFAIVLGILNLVIPILLMAAAGFEFVLGKIF